MFVFLRRRAGVLLLGVGLSAPLSAQAAPEPVPVPGFHDGGYLVFRSSDGRFQYWIDGRLQVDAATYTGGQNELASGTAIRRARLGLKAQFHGDWYSEFDVDFAGNEVDVKDAWIGYTGFENTMIRAGQFVEPFSLQTLTSSKEILFMERSYIDILAPDRNIGLSLSRWGAHWQAAAGIFGEDAGASDQSGRDEGYGITGRATVAPVIGDRTVIHLGVAASRRTPRAGSESDTNVVRFSALPESYVSQARFLSTGDIRAVKHATHYNGEAAVVLGSVTLQAEYSRVTLRRLDNLPDATFSGGYLSAHTFLTGDSRSYDVADGEFERVQPRRPGGAWELGARYSVLNLNDDSDGVDIMGGKATNYTVGVTWYMNTNLKWMFNYVRVVNDDHAEPNIGRAPFVTGDTFNVFQTRVALAF